MPVFHQWVVEVETRKIAGVFLLFFSLDQSGIALNRKPRGLVL